MNRNKILTLLFLVFSSALSAQETTLSIDSAIRIALEKNYDVQFYSNLSEIAKNNNTIGNAGMLPVIDLSGTVLKYSTNNKQEYSDGTSMSQNSVATDYSNADAGLTWTVFDGLKMFHTKKKLDGLFYRSEQQLKIQMETTISDVIQAYYSILRNRQLLKSTQQQILLLQERMQLAERKMNNGSGSKLDLLQA